MSKHEPPLHPGATPSCALSPLAREQLESMAQFYDDPDCIPGWASQNYHERLAANGAYFGDFYPFDDFDLLFGAGKLGLRIMDVPLGYCDRTYRSTTSAVGNMAGCCCGLLGLERGN